MSGDEILEEVTVDLTSAGSEERSSCWSSSVGGAAELARVSGGEAVLGKHASLLTACVGW